MNLQIPLSLPEMVSNIAGLIVLAFFIGQWAKSALPDWRYTNWVVLAAVTIVGLLGTFILAEWKPTAEDILWEAILAMMAVSIETFGYEGLSNLLGLLGKGGRSDEALAQKAIATVLKDPSDSIPALSTGTEAMLEEEAEEEAKPERG